MCVKNITTESETNSQCAGDASRTLMRGLDLLSNMTQDNYYLNHLITVLVCSIMVHFSYTVLSV